MNERRIIDLLAKARVEVLDECERHELEKILGCKTEKGEEHAELV